MTIRSSDGLALSDGGALGSPLVRCGDREFSVVDFLRQCELSLRRDDAAADAALTRARDLLLAGGLPAVRSMSTATRWIQFGLRVAARTGDIYAELAQLADDARKNLGARNVFFMHKPPGVRIRFEVAGPRSHEAEHDLTSRVDALVRTGIATAASRGVYEPEAYLFGGPVSMESVHRLFTADSAAWLGYHRLRALDVSPGPAWAFSLALLHRLFLAMGVVGWEDRDVWDRVRRQTGRTLSPPQRAVDGYGQVADIVRRAWDDDRILCKQLSGESASLVDAFGLTATADAARWHDEYFSTSAAYIGPREATAYYIVYHWNRGGLSDVRQAAITEALAGRSTS
jgi:thiopeptide-type bacteriocin biosynthesis protein